MRTGLAALTDSANRIIPTLVVGFARGLAAGGAVVTYSHPHGISEYRLSGSQTPAVLLAQAADVSYAGPASIESSDERPLEWQLRAVGVRAIMSLPIPDADPSIRFWLGLPEHHPLTGDQTGALQELAVASSVVLRESIAGAVSTEHLSRLELAADLLPAVRDVLDVRDVFERLSATSQAALPHDMLTLGVFSDDLATMTVYGRTGAGSDLGRVLPQPYPPAVTQAWELDTIDDRASYPFERDRPPARLGMRSSLRVSIRHQGKAIGGLGFHSLQHAKYSSVDIAIGRRLADYVAMALIHYKLAEDGRRAAALQERTTNLDLLDGLMDTVTGVLDVREVFDRIFELSQQALPHDAMSIAVPSQDGTRATLYARTGALRHLPVPWEQPLQDTSLVQRVWDHVLIGDLPADPVYAPLPSVQAGMRSLIIIPVRLEEQLRAWVNFWSASLHHFTPDDVPVARRIAAHITLTLSHQRIAEQARLNEQLRARTTNLELLDELLSALTGSADLRDVFNRISTIAGKVLPHDAVALLIRLPDGRNHLAYAMHGLPQSAPSITPIPQELLENSDWEHDVFDEVSSLDERYAGLLKMGIHSLLRVPLRWDGQFAGTLIFFAKAPSAFNETDVPVARRIADRMAVVLARDRVIEASKRADEAAARAVQLEARVRALTDELDARTGYRRVIGQSPQWRQVLTQATQVAATETTALLLGESGTGKEVVARFLHRGSPRKNGPFVALNCAALPEQLLEAELFGYERGAYTGATQSKPGQLEQAAGGTLFLDEVAEMSLSAQAKFLRVLQEREFQRLGGTRVLRTDARVIAATNRDLLRAIANGQFREDLYYRLNVFAIRLPRLRDRQDDILPLSEAFLAEIGRGLGTPPAGISRDARQRLVDYHWPGNVRELRNILERAAILCDGGLITSEHLAIHTPIAQVAAASAHVAVETVAAVPAASAGAALPASANDLQAMERTMIEQALQSARFNKSKAAKALGLTRRQLYARMSKYGLD